MMKVKIKVNAHELYLANNFGIISDYWDIIFNKISGKTLEVNTDLLFKDEYNIKPKKGILNNEIRMFDEYIDKIIDDARIGKPYCTFCDHFSTSNEVCSFCERSNYLENEVQEMNYNYEDDLLSFFE